jgi:ATP-binding cassette subfamily B protein
MGHKSCNGSRGIRHELKVILRQARQVWRLVPHRHAVAFGIAALVMALGSACNTAMPLLMGRLVDGVKNGTEQAVGADALWRLAVFYLVLLAGTYAVREGLNVLRRCLVENSCTRLDKLMTVRLVSHLLKSDLGTLTHEKVGALQGRISRSVVGFIRFLRLAFLDFFPPILSGGFALAAALTKQPWLALAMAGVIPVSLLLTVRQMISQKGIRLKLIRSRETMEGTVVEQLSGLDYVRAANTLQLEVARVAREAEKRRSREVRHHSQMSLFGCAKALNEGFFHVLVLAVAIWLAVRGTISFGDILTFSMLFLNVMAPLNEVHRALDEGHECSLLVADLLDMLREPVDRSFSPRQVEEPRLELGIPTVVLDGLQVEYPTAEGDRKEVLHGVSLTIRHGDTIGVAGRSGGGKSTWLRVLMRLVHPSGGRVLLGGVPLEHVSREAIGRLIGYVGQSPFVFAGTIEENIAYGTEGATGEAIRHAAEMAHIHHEILAMPGGYDAPVAERGSNLSGGQRQRLALARVFLKNPPILVLDEGTSALDTISERHVQRAIEAAREDRTVILVAHRLSTLRDADRIVVFDDGRLVETGTYADLLSRGGGFTELVRNAGSVHVPLPGLPAGALLVPA